MQRKRYTSDISQAQFDVIRPMLEGLKHKTQPRRHDLYDIFCGILYVLKSGCTWRLLLGDFPPWRTVHEYFWQWSTGSDGQGSSLLESALKK
jgi:transposase